MHENEARLIARRLADSLVTPFVPMLPQMQDKRLTLLDVLALGATILSSNLPVFSSDSDIAAANRTFLSALISGLKNRRTLEEFLFNKLMKTEINPAELERGILDISQLIGNPKRMRHVI